jgi:titin
LVVLAAVAPGAPTELNVTESGEGTLNLEWTPPEETGGSVLTGYYLYYQKSSSLLTDPDTWLKSAEISHTTTTSSLVGLEGTEQYRVKIVAANVRGEGAFSKSVTHFAGAVPSGLTTPSAVLGSRTLETIGIQWSAPSTSTTDVLGYRLYVNEPSSNAIPTELVYDGAAIANVY